MARASLKVRIATLLTDFGTNGPYAAAMKGAILRRYPLARLVDISHDIPAHDVLTAAFVLAQAAPQFPPGTVHVVVVDPGVGTQRRIMAATFGEQTFLFPDNGVITFVAETMPLERIVVVRNTKYLPPADPSATFHGRDIFAPIAGHVLGGVDIDRLGPQPETYKLLEVPTPAVQGDALVGQVIYVDTFGNLVSNITDNALVQTHPALDRVRVFCAGRDVGPLQGAYGFVDQGRPLAIVNSMGRIEVAINRGRACDALDAGLGTEIRVQEAKSA